MILITLTGIIVTIIIILALSSMVLIGMLPEKVFTAHGGKLALIFGVMISTLMLRKRGRGVKTKYALICAGAIWCILTLIAFACNEDASIWAAIISLVVSLFTAFILSIPKIKNSKMHKRRVTR